MVKLAVVAVMLACVGCGMPGDRVQRRWSADGDHTFRTRCRRDLQCIDDMRHTCPGGFVELGTVGDAQEREKMFKCHGKANW